MEKPLETDVVGVGDHPTGLCLCASLVAHLKSRRDWAVHGGLSTPTATYFHPSKRLVVLIICVVQFFLSVLSFESMTNCWLELL